VGLPAGSRVPPPGDLRGDAPPLPALLAKALSGRRAAGCGADRWPHACRGGMPPAVGASLPMSPAPSAVTPPD